MASAPTFLPSTPNTVRWGRLPSQAAEPVATIDSGDVLEVETISHEGMMPDQGADPVAFFGSHGIPQHEVLADVRHLAEARLPFDPAVDGSHVVTGPIAVRGAMPGDVLRVQMLSLKCRTRYGIISNRHGRGVLSGEFPLLAENGEEPGVVSHLATVVGDGRVGQLASRSGRTLHFPLAPFLGLMGVAPATDIELSSRPPGPFGGNLDIRHLAQDSSLLLPVLSPGALLYMGDPHFSQGNGEVALTAFEAPLRAHLRVSIERDPAALVLAAQMAHPWGETDDHFIAVGLGETLDDAMRSAVRNAVTMVTHYGGVDEPLALSYLSAAADFEVSQAVNGTRGIHCMIRRSDLIEEFPADQKAGR